MSGPALAVEGLRFERRGSSFRLEIETLELKRGSVLAILGPNGAGKSTLLRCLAGLEREARGAVVLAPSGIATLVFQAPAVFSGSVAHNVRAALYGTSLHAVDREARIETALRRFEILPLANRRAATLSGGELRRLALARAFVLDPTVLLLDEPFDDLDASGQAALAHDLHRVIHDTDVAVAMVTHDLRRALWLADRIAVMEGGRIVQQGSREELLLAPESAGVARLLGMSNLISGTLERVDADVWTVVDAEHRIPVATNLPAPLRVMAGIRPEDLQVDGDVRRGISMGKGVVRNVMNDGTTETLTVVWAGCELNVVRLASRSRAFVSGDAVSLAVDRECVHLIREE